MIIYYNSISSQRKSNAVLSFADAFESSFKQNNVTNDLVLLDSMFPHAALVMVGCNS